MSNTEEVANEPQPDFGLALHKANTGDYANAADIFRQILTQTLNADAASNAGFCLKQLHRNDESLIAYRQALIIDPSHSGVLVNLGSYYIDCGDLAAAERIIYRACQIAPNDIGAQINLGTVFYSQGRYDEAETIYRRLITLQPDHIHAHRNLANVLLLKGEIEEGFREYEWRRHFDDIALALKDAALKKPRWLGESLAGRTLFVITEQGHGDTLQFLRYGAVVRRNGGRMVMTCHPPLARLLGNCPVLDCVVTNGDTMPEYDFHVPLLSLPYMFGTTLANVPTEIPYLQVRDEWVAEWAPVLGPRKKPRVGLVWAGSPTHKNDRNRSLPIHRLAPFLADDRIDWISLQVGLRPGDESYLAQTPALRQLATPFRDYADTAVVISQLDLVVTVDTSVAHLAGALGIPVWVLIPTVPDWRWMLEGSDTPWYPTMRLFRQSQIGNWDTVIDRLHKAFTGWMGSTTVEGKSDTH